ncbi:hypothetical protein LJB93_01260 [Desulfovibrio sp. OttesenSCG-928-F07]|nr:hypothetical protein [Desulfovibrio sp. OttesenSCG-928-F07]
MGSSAQRLRSQRRHGLCEAKERSLILFATTPPYAGPAQEQILVVGKKKHIFMEGVYS